jgi:hypothetical protein
MGGPPHPPGDAGGGTNGALKRRFLRAIAGLYSRRSLDRLV